MLGALTGKTATTDNGRTLLIPPPPRLLLLCNICLSLGGFGRGEGGGYADCGENLSEYQCLEMLFLLQ